MPAYAELYCLSNFSFLRGASHPEELVRRAARLGYSALAITDECSLAGVVRAHRIAKHWGIPLLIGCEARLDDGTHLVLLAPDREAYGGLAALITRGRRAAGKGHYRLTRRDAEQYARRCLALLVPPYPCVVDRDRETARWLAGAFVDRAWLALERHHGAQDALHRACVQQLADETGLPVTAAGGVLMHTPGRRAVADTVTAIRRGMTLDDAGTALQSNGERHLRTRRRLASLYEPALLEETVRIAGRCHFSLDELRYEYPEELVPPEHTPPVWLRRLTEEGMAWRWPAGAPATVRRQVDHELGLIAELGYEHYFLTVHDLVRFARSRGILCQGRGSAANSAVCFCLGITEVDPSRMATLFERFVSKERDEPPDIDVDFEHERREEVIQYAYGKYGTDRVALAATVITYRLRSAVRDAGKALGLDAACVDHLAGGLAWWDGRRLRPERLRDAGLDPEQPRMRRYRRLVNTLIGFPRHLSQHVGGLVIARGPLARLVPVENAAMADRTVIQWDKDDLDAMGLLKVDCLCLGMLSAVRRAFDLVAAHRGRRLTMATVPAEDPAVYAMLQRADAIGVFQVESRAQMSMLPRLRPECFYDLVIQVAIVRPGPIQGGMVHPYLQRRRQPEGWEDEYAADPEVKAVLERTLGIPIFQEQVIQLAMVAAGFDAGEADALRRAMAAWKRRGGLAPFEQRLVEGMRARGHSEAFARRIFRQIQGFGEYGFPESHAASFALLVYVSAWLKCHEPAAFTCALLNSQPMGFYAPAQLVQDARRHGVEVRPVDVRASDWDCTLEPAEGADQPALRLGLRMAKGMSRAGAGRLTAARADAPFDGAADLAARARLSRRDLDSLAAAGALAGWGDRHQAHWQIMGIAPAAPLFAASPPEAPVSLPAVTEGEDTVADYASLGLTLGRHPLALLRRHLSALGCREDAVRLYQRPHNAAVRIAGLVLIRQRPGSSQGVVFLTLEDETGSFNVIVHPRLVEQQRQVLLGARLLAVDGTVQREGDVLHVIARRLGDRTALLGRLPIHSRDFH